MLEKDVKCVFIIIKKFEQANVCWLNTSGRAFFNRELFFLIFLILSKVDLLQQGMQWGFQISIKYLSNPLTIVAKSFILDVWQGSEYDSGIELNCKLKSI